MRRKKAAPDRPLTAIQRSILDAYKQNPRASYEEISQAVGCCKSTVARYVLILSARGYMRVRPNTCRAVKLTKKAS
jgi:DNA-binding Lrp family transcriptional regulator